MSTSSSAVALPADRAHDLPGLAQVVVGDGGLPVLRIASALARAEVHLLGATVTRFQPVGEAEVLWVAQRAIFAEGTPIRGGIPVCWPWFGPHSTDSKLPSHGFVRTRLWRLAELATLPGGEVRAVLSLGDDAATRALWPQAFALRLTVTVGRGLDVALTCRNAGTTPWLCSEALHSYLAIGDVRRCAVIGTGNAPFIDKIDGNKPKLQEPEALRFTGPVDRPYLGHAGPLTVVDEGWRRSLLIDKRGSATSVLWNPGPSKVIADMGSAEWSAFVCAEAGNCLSDAVTVAPGAEHTLATTISVAG